MSEGREMILANFQGVTGIENVEEAIMWLENANWDLLDAIKNAIPQETQSQGDILASGKIIKKKPNGRVPVTIASDFLEMPSTSDPQGIVEIHVHYMDSMYKLQVPDSINVGCIKTIIYSDTGIPTCQQVITGWPATPGITTISDETVLKRLNITEVLHLYLDTPETPAQSSNVTKMDVEEPVIDVEDWEGSDSDNTTEVEKKDYGKAKTQNTEATSIDHDISFGGRRSRSGRLVKRLKREEPDIDIEDRNSEVDILEVEKKKEEKTEATSVGQGISNGVSRTRRRRHVKKRKRKEPVIDVEDSDTEVEVLEVGKKKEEKEKSEATSVGQGISNGVMHSRSRRHFRIRKRDNSTKLLIEFKILDESSNKEFTLKCMSNITVGQFKMDADALTDIPVSDQVWCGWPGKNVTDSTKLCEMDLDYPFHCLILSRSGESRASSTGIRTAVCAPRIPSPIFIDLVDTDSSPDDFEDASESFAVEDEMFTEEIPEQNRLASLIPDNVEDETAGSVHFIDGYTQRYGPTSPNFFPGTLEDAIKEACLRSARERRMLAIYLHHDGSVLSNVFCTELLGSETVLQTFTNYFVVWGWDITNRGNREMFINSVNRLLGSTVTENIRSINSDLLPALLIVSRSRSNTELLNIIFGNIGINELLTMLMHAVDVFSDMQETEIKEEEERAAREQIKREQDKAYQKSLQMDIAKEQAKKQLQMLETQEQERLQQEQKIQEEHRKAEMLAAESRLPVEPDKEASDIITFRFRPPTGDVFERRFLTSNKLQDVFDYLLIKGFRINEFKFITSWPKRDISALDGSQILQELKLYPQESIILEQR